jgi:hypothetical protein
MVEYVIQYVETIKRTNSVTIEVENENRGEEIADELFNKQGNFDHPDDILYEINKMGVKIIETGRGYDLCEYEIE